MSLSRRDFLRGASGGLGFLAAATSLGRWASSARAATLRYPGYRAAVSVFFFGGNDGNNLIVPRATNAQGTGAFDRYLQARPDVGIPRADLRPITPAGLAVDSYGLHPALEKLQALFGQNKAAFVANVGPLVSPIRKSEYTSGTVERPDNLFSHIDQQDAWASAVANPSATTGSPTGWGGRIADEIEGLNAGDYPEVTSFGGKPLFGVGAVRRQLVASSSGASIGIKPHSDADFNALREEALAGVLAATNGVAPEEAYSAVLTAATTFSAARDAARDAGWAALPQATRDAIDAVFTTGASASWTLDKELYQVVRDLVAGATPVASGGLGLKRQVFSAGIGGFDTHTGQVSAQDSLLTQVDFALNAFYVAISALQSSGVFGASPPQATLFTQSDFGRTLKENANNGSDHGWGSHAIVLGDQVVGGKLYGKFPSLDLTNGGADNQDTVDDKGRWIPAVSVEQYANTLAVWLGVTAAERPVVFPLLDAYVADAIAGGYPNLAQQYRLGFLPLDP